MAAALALGAVVLGGASCRHRATDDEASLGPRRPEFLRYTGYAADGALVARGWLHLGRVRGGTLEGEWWIERVGSAQPAGPQPGVGEILGRVEAGEVVLELHPDRRDDNVTLVATRSHGELRGRWEWNGIAGLLASGTFVAVPADDEEDDPVPQDAP